MFCRRGLPAFLLAIALTSPAVSPAASSAVNAGRTVRIVNAMTGQSLHRATVRSMRSPDRRAIEVQTSSDGAQRWVGAVGSHMVEIAVPGFQAMVAEVPLGNEPMPVIFRLQPEDVLAELRPERVLARTRADSTLILGFVVDHADGRPLVNATVRSLPSGVETSTDGRGLFELIVPVLQDETAASPQLIVERPGYRSEVRRNVELWPGGDWTYQVRLSRGAGELQIDERQTRRWSGAHGGGKTGPEAGAAVAVMAAEEATIVPASTSPTNLTVRIPRAIRVLYTNAVIYETLENYCRHVLPAEWISSWGGYAGGSNSLQAGAVALRTYAVGYVHQPSSGTYDICATTACQVYNPNLTTARADLAVAQTSGYVMVSSNLNITRGLTEYSAENNQVGMACGMGIPRPQEDVCMILCVRVRLSLAMVEACASGEQSSGRPV